MRGELESAIRDRLADLADAVPSWRLRLRELHLDAGLVDDDWIDNHCAPEVASQHRQYLREFWRETLMFGRPSVIVYSDEPCQSTYLNELKRRRFERYGPVQPLLADPRTRHLAELSVGGQYLSRIDERATNEDIELFRARARIVDDRLDVGRRHHARAVDEASAWLPERSAGELEIADSLARFIAHCLNPVEATVSAYRLVSKRETRAVRVRCADCAQLFAVVVVGPRGGGAWSVSLGWRLLSEGQHDSMPEGGGVLHIEELLPFSRYYHANSIRELRFPFVAFGELARILAEPLTAAIFEALPKAKA